MVGEIKKPTANPGKWTDDEKIHLESEYQSNMSIDDIAIAHSRSEFSIRVMLDKLGLLEIGPELERIRLDYKNGKAIRTLMKDYDLNEYSVLQRVVDVKKDLNPQYCIYKNREKFLSAEKWSPQEEEDLVVQYLAGIDFRDLAHLHGRTLSAIRTKLDRWDIPYGPTGRPIDKIFTIIMPWSYEKNEMLYIELKNSSG